MNAERRPAAVLAFTDEQDLATHVTNRMLAAIGGSVGSHGWTVDELAALSMRVLLNGKSLTDLSVFTHVLVPAARQSTVGQRDPLADLDGLHSTVARARESRILALDVVTFCPIPLPRWQAHAQKALEAHREAWSTELRHLRDVRREGSLQHVPFLRFLVPSDEPEQWASTAVVNVNLTGILESGSETTTSLTVLRRPFIAWPVDSRTPGRHVATMRPSGRMFRFRGRSFAPPWPGSSGRSEFIRPLLDTRAFEDSIKLSQYRAPDPAATV